MRPTLPVLFGPDWKMRPAQRCGCFTGGQGGQGGPRLMDVFVARNWSIICRWID